MRVFSRAMPRADFNYQVLVAPMEVSAQAMNDTSGFCGRLATPGGLDRTTRTRLEYAPAHRANVGPSLINVASSCSYRLKRHQDLRKDGDDLNQAVGLIGGADELRRALVQARGESFPPPRSSPSRR